MPYDILGISRQELSAMCPREYLCDYLTWLLTICGAILVWNTFYATGSNGLNAKQKIKLKQLKKNGLYRGEI